MHDHLSEIGGATASSLSASPRSGVKPPLLEYYTDVCGVVHQLNPNPIRYGAEYLAEHMAKPHYAEMSTRLNHLRLGLVLASVREPISLVDFGCGDGSFAALAAQAIPDVAGYDIHDLPIPVFRVARPVRAQIYTFWDALEHVEKPGELMTYLQADRVFITVPCMEGHDFMTWKHRRPDEHLHHFTPASLADFMRVCGWYHDWTCHAEDVVRGQLDGRANTLTAAFSR